MRVNASTHPTAISASGRESSSSNNGDDLLLLSNPSSSVGRTNLSIHGSLDGGHVWQPVVVVEDRGLRGSGYAHMVAMTPDPVTGAGRVGVLYVQNWHVAAQTNGPGDGDKDNHTFALIQFPVTTNTGGSDATAQSV